MFEKMEKLQLLLYLLHPFDSILTENPTECDGSAFKSLLCFWAIKVKMYFDNAI